MLNYLFFISLALFSLNLPAADFDYYQKQFDTDAGKKFIAGYKDFYQPHVADSVINNVHTTIESVLATRLREITAKLYDAVIKKTLSDISASTNTPWNSDQLALLNQCINDKSDYSMVENKCVPRMLWSAGYEEFSTCFASELRSTMNSCMGVNTSS